MSERPPAQPAIPPEPNASDEPHDVLAAEEFAMPAPEAAMRDDGPPVALPPDPGGDEPHDVLAAEEFAMPAPPPGRAFPQAALDRATSGRAGGAAKRAFGFALALGFTFAMARLRRRARRARRNG